MTHTIMLFNMTPATSPPTSCLTKRLPLACPPLACRTSSTPSLSRSRSIPDDGRNPSGHGNRPSKFQIPHTDPPSSITNASQPR